MSVLHQYSADECVAAFVEEMNVKAAALGAV